MASYATPTELKASNIWLDFSVFSDPELQAYADLATEMIDTYLGRTFLPWPFTETKETTVDKETRIFVALENSNVDEVTALTFRLLDASEIVADVTYIDLYNKQGYFYYNTSLYQGNSYPQTLLAEATRVTYTVSYTVIDDVPLAIKQASIQICWNLLKPQVNYDSTGAVLQTWDLKGFTSGDYKVDYDNSKMNTYGTAGQANPVMTPTVLAMINFYRRAWQSRL